MIYEVATKAWLRRSMLALSPLVLSAQPAPAAAAPPPPPAAANLQAAELFRLMGSGSFLGVGVREVETARAKELNLREEYGVEVTKVEADSPAEKAGLKVGDVVQEYQGQRVEGTEQFVRMVRETPPGRTVKMTAVRNGSPQTLTATLATRKGAKVFSQAIPMEGMRVPEREFNIMIPDVPKAMMSWRSGMIGIEGESLTDSQLASFFGVKEGVLVRSVLKNSPAEKAGIRAGDVLVKVNDSRVTSTRDVTAAIRSARPAGKKVFAVALMRDRKEMTVTVTMDEEPHGMNAPRSRSVVSVQSPE